MPALAGTRVLMTADAVGGVWPYAMELARGLAARGVGTVLATMGPPPSPDRRLQALSVPGLKLHEGDFALEWMADGARDADAAGEWLLRLARDSAVDLIHLNGYAHAGLPWRRPVLLTAHSCVRTWWRAVHGRPPPHEWRGYARMVRRGLSAADLTVAPTRAFLDALSAEYGPPACARVIWNGREAARYAPAPKEAHVLTAGRLWDEAKNLRLLAEAAAGLDLPVLVAGDRAAPDGGGAAPDGALRHLGRLGEEQMRRRYAAAAVFALPARYEPFGLAVLEAALSGCALVLGDIPTFRELWRGAALFVPTDDADRLRQVLRCVLRHPQLAAALGAKAHHRGRRYGQARMLAGYAAAYGELLAVARAARPAPAPVSEAAVVGAVS